MITRRSIGNCNLCFLFAVAAFAGCGGGGSSPHVGATTAPSSSSGAFLASITPGPGIPTAPPASWTPDPNQTAPPPQPTMSPTFTKGTQSFSGDQLLSPSASPLPIEQALANEGQTAVADALVVGDVSGFTHPNSIVVTVVPDVQIDPTSGPLDSLPSSLPQQVTLQITGQTYNGIPGGFANLHVGDPILAGMEGTGSTGVADFVVALPGKGSLETALINQSASARERPAALSGGIGASYTAFSMAAQYPAATAKGIVNDTTFPALCFAPSLPINISVCVTTAFHWVVGNIANFPMGLVDETTASVPAPWTIDTSSVLPIALNPETGSSSTNNASAHYSFIGYGSLTFKVDGHFLGKTYADIYPFGLGYETNTGGDLPASGKTLPLTVVRGLNGQFDLLPFICKLAQSFPKANPYIAAVYGLCKLNDSVSALGGHLLSIPVLYKSEIDDTITGGDITVDSLSISNASPASAESLSFNISGDKGPNFSATPQSGPNLFTLSGLQYMGNDAPTFSLNVQTIGPAINLMEPLSNFTGVKTSVLQNMHEYPSPVTISICPANKESDDVHRATTASTCPTPAPAICMSLVSGSLNAGSSPACSNTATGFLVNLCYNEPDCSYTTATVQISEPGYSGLFTASQTQSSLPSQIQSNPADPGNLCGDTFAGVQSQNVITVSPTTATGSPSNFTVTIGAPRNTSATSSVCSIVFYDSDFNLISLGIVMVDGSS